MNLFEVLLVGWGAVIVGALVGALIRRWKARSVTGVSGPVDALAEQQAAKRFNDMQGWRYGVWHSGRAAPLPPNDSV